MNINEDNIDDFNNIFNLLNQILQKITQENHQPKQRQQQQQPTLPPIDETKINESVIDNSFNSIDISDPPAIQQQIQQHQQLTTNN